MKLITNLNLLALLSLLVSASLGAPLARRDTDLSTSVEARDVIDGELTFELEERASKGKKSATASPPKVAAPKPAAARKATPPPKPAAKAPVARKVTPPPKPAAPKAPAARKASAPPKPAAAKKASPPAKAATPKAPAARKVTSPKPAAPKAPVVRKAAAVPKPAAAKKATTPRSPSPVKAGPSTAKAKAPTAPRSKIPVPVRAKTGVSKPKVPAARKATPPPKSGSPKPAAAAKKSTVLPRPKSPAKASSSVAKGKGPAVPPRSKIPVPKKGASTPKIRLAKSSSPKPVAGSSRAKSPVTASRSGTKSGVKVSTAGSKAKPPFKVGSSPVRPPAKRVSKPSTLKKKATPPLSPQKLSEKLVSIQNNRQTKADTKKKVYAEALEKAGGVKPKPVPKFSKDMTEEQKQARKQIKDDNKKLSAVYRAERDDRRAYRIANKPWEPQYKAKKEAARVAKAVSDTTAAWDLKDAKLAKIAAKNQKSWEGQKTVGKITEEDYNQRMAKAAQDKADAAKKRADAIAEAGKPAPPAPPKPPRMTPDEKKQVKAAFEGAATELSNTKNLPGRKDTYTVGKDTFTGKDVRQGIYNAHLHKDTPVGGYNKKPTQFNNTPYRNLHPDTSLAGKAPIAASDYNTASSLEMPILKNSKTGYNGKGDVGAGRVITWNGDAGKNKFVVVGHDDSRGDPEDAHEHYIATYKQAT